MMNIMDATASSASSTPACTLPPQLLALVLARLEPAERLGTMARVCSTWHAAAVIATNSITASGPMWRVLRSGINQVQASALSGWLQAHAAAAALDSLAVQGDRWNFAILQLPVQQLASLRSLDLERITVAVQGREDAQAAFPDLPPELSGITRLRLWDADVGLSTLPAFTNLRHLAIVPGRPQISSLELSGLLQLTHLRLSQAYAQDAVLASLTSLTCLQELEVDGSTYTANGLAALPASLTKLCVSGTITLAPGSTPAVAQLTALQWLEVTYAAGFSTAVLRSMSSLQHLAVRSASLLPAATGDDDNQDSEESDEEEAREVDLSVLRGLTQLQHLELPVGGAEHAAADPEADVAALTASSQLTCLDIAGLVEQQHYCSIFPEGRRLPELRELRATMGLLGSSGDAEALTQCCPNLERLEVDTVLRGEPVLEEFEGDEHDWCSVVVLRSLHSLTRLAINVRGIGLEDYPVCDEVFWRSMAELTTLRDLYINDLYMEHFGGIVELVSCTQLTHLMADFYAECSDDFEMGTPEGQPPDIWRRLPQEALQAALQYYKDNLDFPEAALRSMAWAAAQHSLQLDRELRREVGELQATVAGLESRLQQQDQRLQQQDQRLLQQQWQQQEVANLRAGLESRWEQEDKQRQQVADMTATMAAMGAQLQALLVQNHLQQG